MDLAEHRRSSYRGQNNKTSEWIDILQLQVSLYQLLGPQMVAVPLTSSLPPIVHLALLSIVWDRLTQAVEKLYLVLCLSATRFGSLFLRLCVALV